MKNIIYTFLLFFCYNTSQGNTLENKINTKEFFKAKNSLVFYYIKNDSLIESKYNEVFKLYKKESYVLALKESLILYDECKGKGDVYWAYKFSSLIGDIYYKTNKFNEYLEHHKKSLAQIYSSILEEGDSRFTDVDFAKTLLRVGTSYHSLFVSTKEKDKIHYLDSAKLYYEKVEKLSGLNSKIQHIKASAFSNLSGIYEQDSIFDKAVDYAKKAIEIHKKNHNNLSTANSLNNLGNIFLSQREYEKSKETYYEALELISNDNNPKTIRTKASLYYNLAWAMRNLKDYKAYDFQEMSYEIEGDIREKEFRGIIDEITQKHDFDSKKELFQKQEENKRLKAQKPFWISGIIALIIILSLIYIININKLKQNNLALKLTQSELIKNQELDKLRSESQARILNATIDGKESERKEIAETLHDSVSTLLSSANLHLQATRKQFNGSTPIEIDKTQEIILEASHKIRDLSHTLVSSVLLKFGLNFAIKDIAEKYSNSELNIETDINNIKRYHQNFEIKVYNIIQEFLNNILKHSEASYAFIELKEENNKLYFTISDDGLGFDKTKISTKTGLGINQIEARIQMMKGQFDIQSSKNNGTKISVVLPIIEKEKLTSA